MYSISQAVAIVPKTHCLKNPESLVEFPNGQGDISTNGSCYPENKKKSNALKTRSENTHSPLSVLPVIFQDKCLYQVTVVVKLTLINVFSVKQSQFG